MTEASPADVDPGVITTSLSTDDVQRRLNDAAFEIDAEDDIDRSAMTTDEEVQLEKYLAALRIREWADRAVKEGSGEASRVVFEGMSLQGLRAAVHRRDPSGNLASSVRRDSDRKIQKA